MIRFKYFLYILLNSSIHSLETSPALRGLSVTDKTPLAVLNYLKIDTYSASGCIKKQTDVYLLNQCVKYSSTLYLTYSNDAVNKKITTKYYTNSLCTIGAAAPVSVVVPYVASCSSTTPAAKVGTLLTAAPTFVAGSGTLISYYQSCSATTPIVWYSFVPNYKCVDGATTSCSGNYYNLFLNI
jgi:hypothetical protein